MKVQERQAPRGKEGEFAFVVFSILAYFRASMCSAVKVDQPDLKARDKQYAQGAIPIARSALHLIV